MTEPERLDRFMARANAAYYARQDPFADFTTAPEISQVFGELIGAWAAVVWAQMRRPDPVLLVEAGPGRGTLMADALRTVSRVAADFRDALAVHFIETSPRLRAEQARRVPEAAWHDRLEDVPPGPAIVIANEFLDALPVRQFVKQAGTWGERYVAEGVFVTLPCMPAAEDLPQGTVIEHGEAAQAWVASLSTRLVRDGGAALIIDYGYAEPQPGNSLQALRGGRPSDPLVEPGTADLTAHVDFSAIAGTARSQGAQVWGPIEQRHFLGALGLHQRIGRLAAQHPDRAEALYAASQRLTLPSQMGSLFKVLGLTIQGLQPPGF
jgi:SAM-dependent MidA family methyltransferase